MTKSFDEFEESFAYCLGRDEIIVKIERDIKFLNDTIQSLRLRIEELEKKSEA